MVLVVIALVHLVFVANYSVTVGAGGTVSTSPPLSPDSSIANVATSTGGGAGGNQIGTRYDAGDGGSAEVVVINLPVVGMEYLVKEVLG